MTNHNDSTSRYVTIYGESTTSSASMSVHLPDDWAVQTGRASKKIENAVYAHIQALRAVGHTQANTAEISKALRLPRVIVEQAIAGLSKKGVKLLK